MDYFFADQACTGLTNVLRKERMKMGMIFGFIAAIIVFVVLIVVGGALITAFAWIAVGILALILFLFFGFMLKWLLIILIIVAIWKLVKRMFTR